MIPQEAIDILKTYGLAGLVMGFLGWAVFTLYKRNQELHDTLREIGSESVKVNEQMTTALNQMSEVNRTSNAAIQVINDNVKQLLWINGVKAGGNSQ